MDFIKGGLHMKLALLMGVIVTFLVSIFAAGYDAKPGVPKKNQ